MNIAAFLASFFEDLGNAVTSCPECLDFSPTAELCAACVEKIEEARAEERGYFGPAGWDGESCLTWGEVSGVRL